MWHWRKQWQIAWLHVVRGMRVEMNGMMLLWFWDVHQATPHHRFAKLHSPKTSMVYKQSKNQTVLKRWKYVIIMSELNHILYVENLMLVAQELFERWHDERYITRWETCNMNIHHCDIYFVGLDSVSACEHAHRKKMAYLCYVPIWIS